MLTRRMRASSSMLSIRFCDFLGVLSGEAAAGLWLPDLAEELTGDAARGETRPL